MTPDVFIPFGEFLPDQPNYANPGTDVAYNVLPRTAQSYGPMASTAAYSGNALTARCQGALATLDSNGDIAIFAGDVNDLYELVPGSLNFSVVSKSASPYTVASDGRWSMFQFGQQVIATDMNDAPQAFTLGSSSTFADLSGTPPKAKYGASAKNFVVFGFTNDVTFGVQPQRVWWSGINNSTSWPTPGTSAALAVQSDYQDTPGEHGWLQGLAPNLGFADCALFFERAVYRMQYVGAPYFFAFAPAQSVRGTPAPGSIVQLGANVYYLGEDGFYAFDGANSVPIGALKVDKFFFSDNSYAVDQNFMDRVSGAADPINKIIFWAYPDGSAVGGVPNRILAYHVVLNRWSFVIGITVEMLFRSLSIGYTLEGLSPGLYVSMDAIPFPIDSRVWTGGHTLLAGFSSTNFLSYFTGSALQATIDTTEGQYTPGRRTFVDNSRPIVDGGSPTVAVGYRDTNEAALTYTSPASMNSIGECPVRNESRFQRLRVVIPAGSSWQHAQGVQVSARPGGFR